MKKQGAKDEEEVLLERALPIDPGNEFDLDIPPTSGAEYLKRVHLEAKNCPDIVVASVDKRKFKAQTVNISSTNGCQPCPVGFAPPLAWQRVQIANFSEMRQKLIKYKLSDTGKKVKLPVPLAEPNDAEGWCRLCFGRMMVHKEDAASEKKIKKSDSAHGDGSDASLQTDCTITYHESTPPYLSIITHMDQPTIEKVLDYHVQWFEATGFSKNQGQWFYALLASLEKPLTPEACASLRRLARNCCNLRATLGSPDHVFTPQLNLLICLVGRYFGQTDMADR